MPTDPTTGDSLASFEPALASAVVAVLRRSGIPASEQHEPHDRDVTVRVPRGRREEAFAVVASRMEMVHELAAAMGDPEPVAPDPDFAGDDAEESERPVLVFDVLRRYGIMLALVLAPLLVVTLARPSMPLAIALAVFIGGVVAIVAWRDRDAE